MQPKYRALVIGSKPDNNVNIVIDDKIVASNDCLTDWHLHFDEQV